MNKQIFNNLIAGCILVVSVAVLAGCNTSGKAFDAGNVQLIEKGKTTKTDVLKYFGEPLRREIGLHGEVWNYTHMGSKATAAGIVGFLTIGANESETVVNKLSLVFDGDVVKDYHFTNTNRKHSYADKPWWLF